MAAAGLVLLIACANTAGLSLARNAERQKEIAVRLSLGATQWRLLRQFTAESFLLALMGGAAGTLLAFGGTHLLLALFPNDVANLNIPKVTQIPMDRGVFLFALAITLLTALLFGIAPVLKATRATTNGAMKEPARGSTSTRWTSRWRSGIVVAEIVLSLMLLTGAGAASRVAACCREFLTSGETASDAVRRAPTISTNFSELLGPFVARAFVSAAPRIVSALVHQS